MFRFGNEMAFSARVSVNRSLNRSAREILRPLVPLALMCVENRFGKRFVRTPRLQCKRNLRRDQVGLSCETSAAQRSQPGGHGQSYNAPVSAQRQDWKQNEAAADDEAPSVQ